MRWLSFLLKPVCMMVKSGTRPKGDGNNYTLQVAVNFSEETIPIGNIDSVVISLQNAASSETRYRHLEKLAGLYATQIGQLRASKYFLTVKIHTKKNEQDGYEYFERTGFITIGSARSLSTCSLKAPARRIKDDWQGWIVLETTDIKARLPRDGNNPFFQLNISDPGGWNNFYLDRIAQKRSPAGNVVIASGSWECSTGSFCYTTSGEVRDSTALLPFSRALLNKEWDHGEIFISLMDANTLTEKTIFYTYDL